MVAQLEIITKPINCPQTALHIRAAWLGLERLFAGSLCVIRVSVRRWFTQRYRIEPHEGCEAQLTRVRYLKYNLEGSEYTETTSSLCRIAPSTEAFTSRCHHCKSGPNNIVMRGNILKLRPAVGNQIIIVNWKVQMNKLPTPGITRDSHYVPMAALRRWSNDGTYLFAYRILVSTPKVPEWRRRPFAGSLIIATCTRFRWRAGTRRFRTMAVQ